MKKLIITICSILVMPLTTLWNYELDISEADILNSLTVENFIFIENEINLELEIDCKLNYALWIENYEYCEIFIDELE